MNSPEHGLNPYSFDPYLEQVRGLDFYRDDPFLQALLARHCPAELPSLGPALQELSRLVSQDWRGLADQVAQVELRPRLECFDAHNHRVDRLLRPQETLMLERGVFGLGLLSAKMPPWEQLAKRYLVHQLGEFGVLCPLACTEGLVALIAQNPDPARPELEAIRQHCQEGLEGEFGIGAQFMSEIQGGSDIPANVLEARPQGQGLYRLYGNKFFCSAMHADYAVVTAKVAGTQDLGTFIVPAYLPGEQASGRRNGYRINRIKWKMGTVELPTAEVEYEGALAYAVGPTNKGVANAVGIVLTLSRLAVGVSSAAAMTRAVREALLYAQFRQAFGQPVAYLPLAAGQLKALERDARRATAAVFQVHAMFFGLGRRLQAGLDSSEPLELRRARFDLRELIIIQKLCLAHAAVDVIRKAISMFGGHGVMEDFSSLPRLYRDAAVNELWEGPRNVLLMQLHRDLQRAAAWYPPSQFVASLLPGSSKAPELGQAMEDLLADSPFQGLDARSLERAAAWEKLVDRLFGLYQDQALAPLAQVHLLPPGLLKLPYLRD